MKSLPLLIIILCFAVPTNTAFAQKSPFELAQYQEFLAQHQNMTASQLLEMHTTGTFEKDAGISWETAAYHDSIEMKYNLTDSEKNMLQKHGFIVTERLRRDSFGWQLLDVWEKDLPIFISTDAILHAFHFAYDRILVEIESGVLVGRVTELLEKLHGQIPALASRYSTIPGMQQMLRDVDVYCTVPLELMGKNLSPNFPENDVVINEILALISAEMFDVYPFFSENCKEIDFSQFKPRGHYNGGDYGHNPTLSRYFRAMMWLGRIEIYLSPPDSDSLFCPPQTPADIQRQIIDAVLITELMELADANSLYTEIESIISFLVGEQDNVSVSNLKSVIQSVNLDDASQLLDTSVLKQFQDELKTRSFAFQRIQSQILKHDPQSPESSRPASAFMLFGQRYVIDSYVTSKVVYDEIKYNDSFICRLFPSTLDVLFTLGNDAAAQLLVPELDDYHYSTNLAALRYLIDSYGNEFWRGSVYNMWLNSIRALNPPQSRVDLPDFMQTAAWWQQKMNTQLSSWTELRHDNLLYAKPSYTDWVACSYPCGYVEPIPAFYSSLNELANEALSKFSEISFSDTKLKISVMTYFEILHGVTDTLWTISQKELEGTPLSGDEESFIKSTVYREGWYAGGDVSGWYVAMLYGEYKAPGDDGYQLGNFTRSDYLVADYHTTPSDCGGVEKGWVLHAGTGPVDLAIVVARQADGQSVAFTGPVASYYEYTSSNWQRLTDDEWVNNDEVDGWEGGVSEHAFRALASASRPDWVNLYLANTLGESRGNGPSLITSVQNNLFEPPTKPLTFFISQNYPNPFNPETEIRFQLPENRHVTVTIFNILGQPIRKLADSQYLFGSHSLKWNGKDGTARDVSSGVYLYQIQAGDFSQTRKMLLVR